MPMPKIPEWLRSPRNSGMKESERMVWHVLIAVAAMLGILGVLIELWRYGTITVPCCG